MNTVNQKAFTLAEVLITLAIIGVVAALTIPALVQNYKERANVTKVKKYYSLVNNVIRLAVAENGEVPNWGELTKSEESAQMIGNKLKKYLKVSEDCGTGTCKNYKVGVVNFLNGRTDPRDMDFSKNNFYKLGLIDGTELIIRLENDPEFGLYLDTNGNKAPNTLGRDIFNFGGVSSSGDWKGIRTGVDPSDSSRGWIGCNPRFGEGWDCTAWVLNKGNMDYLRCADELTWNGKTSCK